MYKLIKSASSKLNLLNFIFFLLLYGVQDLLSVLYSSSYLRFCQLQSIRKSLISCLVSLTVEQHSLLLRIQQNLTIVVEVHLEDFVAQAEHYCVSRLQPLLYVDESIVFVVDNFVLRQGRMYLRQFGNLIIQMNNKSLEEHVFFLKIPVFGKRVKIVDIHFFIFG